MRLLFVTALTLMSQTWALANPMAQTFDFESGEIGKPLPSWENEPPQSQRDAAKWTVQTDAERKSKVYGITDLGKVSESRFNLAWTKDFKIANSDISADFLAKSGEVDQGGGLMWRVRDHDNYYLASFNALENSFRIYSVKNGDLGTLGNANIKLPKDKWHSIRIKFLGSKIEGYLDGKKYLDVVDSSFQSAGGIGFWTKADAVTAFDNLVVKDLDKKVL